MAKRSIMVAALFGLLSSGFVIFTGDEAAYEDAQHQPMKLAAIEGLYDGERGAGVIAFGMLNPDKKPGDNQNAFNFEIRIPGLLSLLANRSINSFVPGINDLVYGNEKENIMGTAQKIDKGKIALASLDTYKTEKKKGNSATSDKALTVFNENKDYLGYGFLTQPEEVVPPVGMSFYTFHIMVVLGGSFRLVCLAFLYFSFKDLLHGKKMVARSWHEYVFSQHDRLSGRLDRRRSGSTTLDHTESASGNGGPLEPDGRHGADHFFHVFCAFCHPTYCRDTDYDQTNQHRSGGELK